MPGSPLRALCTLVILALAVPAHAEEACKSETLAKPALALADMFEMAQARAKAWKPDAVPARLGNTVLGPLDAEGRSEAWHVVFFSPSADAHVAVSSFRGTLSCWAESGGAGRLPDLAPGFLRDGARLHTLAREHGAALLAAGFGVMAQTAAAPSDRHATWNLSFSRPDSTNGGLLIVVDANTGKVEKVLRDD
jgi:hypothetical protein